MLAIVVRYHVFVSYWHICQMNNTLLFSSAIVSKQSWAMLSYVFILIISKPLQQSKLSASNLFSGKKEAEWLWEIIFCIITLQKNSAVKETDVLTEIRNVVIIHTN